MRKELWAAARAETWAIALSWLETTIELSATAAATKKLPRVNGSVAILPVHGMITQRDSIWNRMFGGTSTDSLAAAFTQAMRDDRIQAVVLDVDSPGGTTYGVQETADVIAAGAKVKPVVAVANSLAASAAYWLSSQVGPGRLFASPSADVGSIGVYRMLDDYSGAMEKTGVRTEFIAIPPEKVEDAGTGPLTDEAREHHKEQVSAVYDTFTKAVARGGGVTQAKVKSSFGKGRVFKSEQAQGMGLVDRIATLGEVLGELTRGSQSSDTVSGEVLDELCHAWETCEACEADPLAWKADIESRRRRVGLLEKV